MSETDPAGLDPDWARSIIAQSLEAVIATDRQGTIRVWNAGAEALFGHAAAEVMGRSLDLIIPERLRRAHWDGFERAMSTGRMRLGAQVLTTRSVHKDGRKLYVEMSFGLLRDAGGTVIGAFAIARDGTQRCQADAALRARLAELEKGLGTTGAGRPDTA